MTSSPTPARAAETDDDALTALANQLTGHVHRADDPGYAHGTPWNVAILRSPLAVVEAATEQDVVDTVRAAAAAGWRVSVQATGHGSAALDQQDDVVVLLTGQLKTLEIDPEQRTARLGSGLVWQEVIGAAAPHGLAPLVGSSPGVGVAGLISGGGVGPFARSFGATCDHVRALRVVTGDGQLLRASADENPDLFWGLLGGKGTLGIITEIELELLPLPEFYGGGLFFDGADAPAVVRSWAKWAATLPEHVTTSIALLQLPPLPMVPPPLAGKLTVTVRFASTEPAEVAEPLLAPLRAVATPILDSVATHPYAAVGLIHSDPEDPMPAVERSTILHTLDDDAVEALLAVAGPGSGSLQTVVEVRQLGGAFATPPRATALGHRDAVFTFLAIGVLMGPPAEHVPANATAVIEALEPWSTGTTLPNWTATADPERIARSYEPETLQRLGVLAEQYDPQGILHVGQVVRSASPS